MSLAWFIGFSSGTAGLVQGWEMTELGRMAAQQVAQERATALAGSPVPAGEFFRYKHRRGDKLAFTH